MNIQNSLRNCTWYFSCLLVVLLTSILMLFINGKSACFISLNSYHTHYLDVFFINYTFIGDGIFAIACTILLYFYFKQKQHGSAMLISFIIVAVTVQVLKNVFNFPRPKIFFNAGQYRHFIEGVSIANYASFPSGHTACAFALATVVVFMIDNKVVQLCILTISMLAGYSRIYLAQHFLLDVVVGATIGTVSGIIGFYLATNVKGVKLFNLKRNQQKKVNGLPVQLQYKL